ncbi:uncharacterized protein KLLA0_E24245g [Kluyveromyces lactis]|uniref:KLLA0E24245p n=1 Tax=Kluyveromyces lactis (strain ATCC 8585 / CBS 2359 / DSM 70799 / NBRC 1267 / NRRL Y-1140 / WM37) TaxID=284590 RepID=B4UN87_KLULA|nr:uncharacterized protein KLLA0_E24245g [Kluyveromyces lactis]CAR56758.1 KLLA0E24245p [Kluyveromyces lactis]|eukprot:XP_002999420.1 uncharacterized protein KLLA0_E24245g [Kluyveromyces lactis]
MIAHWNREDVQQLSFNLWLPSCITLNVNRIPIIGFNLVTGDQNLDIIHTFRTEVEDQHGFFRFKPRSKYNMRKQTCCLHIIRTVQPHIFSGIG